MEGETIFYRDKLYLSPLTSREVELSLISFWEPHGEGGNRTSWRRTNVLCSVLWFGDKKCLAFFWEVWRAERQFVESLGHLTHVLFENGFLPSLPSFVYNILNLLLICIYFWHIVCTGNRNKHRGEYTPSYPCIQKRMNNYWTIAKSTDILPFSSCVFTQVSLTFAFNDTLSFQCKTVRENSTGTLKCFIQSNVFFSRRLRLLLCCSHCLFWLFDFTLVVL